MLHPFYANSFIKSSPFLICPQRNPGIRDKRETSEQENVRVSLTIFDLTRVVHLIAHPAREGMRRGRERRSQQWEAWRFAVIPVLFSNAFVLLLKVHACFPEVRGI